MKSMVGHKINTHIGSGQADSVLRARHGITPQKARRGWLLCANFFDHFFDHMDQRLKLCTPGGLNA